MNLTIDPSLALGSRDGRRPQPGPEIPEPDETADSRLLVIATVPVTAVNLTMIVPIAIVSRALRVANDLAMAQALEFGHGTLHLLAGGVGGGANTLHA